MDTYRNYNREEFNRILNGKIARKLIITATILAGLGFILGEKFGNILGQKSYFLGAVLLIFIAINILI